MTEERDKSFESQCHKWIQALINKRIDLQMVKMDCSDLLELSELLDLCDDSEREFYQDRLTLLIEQLSYYIQSDELIENETNTVLRFDVWSENPQRPFRICGLEDLSGKLKTQASGRRKICTR